ncbi:MAG: hypothetical protein JWP89_5315 [Schlesneria sp.]|nr:hypothetical protein [Schlesneria sp.]
MRVTTRCQIATATRSIQSDERREFDSRTFCQRGKPERGPVLVVLEMGSRRLGHTEIATALIGSAVNRSRRHQLHSTQFKQRSLSRKGHAHEETLE